MQFIPEENLSQNCFIVFVHLTLTPSMSIQRWAAEELTPQSSFYLPHIWTEIFRGIIHFVFWHFLPLLSASLSFLVLYWSRPKALAAAGGRFWFRRMVIGAWRPMEWCGPASLAALDARVYRALLFCSLFDSIEGPTAVWEMCVYKVWFANCLAFEFFFFLWPFCTFLLI